MTALSHPDPTPRQGTLTDDLARALDRADPQAVAAALDELGRQLARGSRPSIERIFGHAATAFLERPTDPLSRADLKDEGGDG